MESGDSNTQDTNTWSAGKRRATIVAPIFVLMIGLGVINWLLPDSRAGTVSDNQPGSEAAVSTTEHMPSSAATPPLLGLATPWGVIGRHTASGSSLTPALPASGPTTRSPIETPIHSPLDGVIELLGPPSDSRFQLSDDISFYWEWPLALEANQRFAVYLRTGSDEWLLGVVEETNMGTSFRLRASPADWVGEPAQYEWLVRLETLPATGTNAGTVVLAGSEVRPLLLAGD